MGFGAIAIGDGGSRVIFDNGGGGDSTATSDHEGGGCRGRGDGWDAGRRG